MSALAVSMTIGIWLVRSSFLSVCSTSKPSFLGIMTSLMIISGMFSMAFAIPSSPLSATLSWYFPAKQLLRYCRTSVLSSMSNTVGWSTSGTTGVSGKLVLLSGRASVMGIIKARASAAWASLLIGSLTIKVVPTPVLLSTSISPCNISTNSLVSASPIPVPSACLVAELSAW